MDIKQSYKRSSQSDATHHPRRAAPWYARTVHTSANGDRDQRPGGHRVCHVSAPSRRRPGPQQGPASPAWRRDKTLDQASTVAYFHLQGRSVGLWRGDSDRASFPQAGYSFYCEESVSSRSYSRIALATVIQARISPVPPRSVSASNGQAQVAKLKPFLISPWWTR